MYFRHAYGPLSYICNFEGAPDPAETILFCIPTRHATAISFLPLMDAMYGMKMVAFDLPGTGKSPRMDQDSARSVGELISYFLLGINCRKILVGHGTGGNLLAWISGGHHSILINCLPAKIKSGWLARTRPITCRDLAAFYDAYGLPEGPLRVCIGMDAVDNAVQRPYHFLFDRNQVAMLSMQRPLLFIIGSQDKVIDADRARQACIVVGITPRIIAAGHMSIITCAKEIAHEIYRVLYPIFFAG